MLPLVQNEEQHLEELPPESQGSLSTSGAKHETEFTQRALTVSSCRARKERHVCQKTFLLLKVRSDL